MKRIIFKSVFTVLFVFVCGTINVSHGALKDFAADIEKSRQNLDIALLKKTAVALGFMANKNPKDHLPPYYAAKAYFTLADCLDIKSSEEFDQTGEGAKHIDKALELIKTSLGIKEDSVDTHILKFHVLRRKMAHVGFPALMMYVSDRQAALDKANKLAPENIEVQVLNAYQVAEGFPFPPPEKIVGEFEKLLKKDPKSALAYYEIGVSWEKAKKTDDAKKNYQKALQIDPNYHWAKKKLKGLTGGSGPNKGP